jgi:hypothetical protein
MPTIPAVFSEIISGIKTAFKNRLSVLSFAVLWILFFIAMFSIPVMGIPGNDISFQSAIFGVNEYLILIALSGLSALSLLLQWVAWRISASVKPTTSGAILGSTGVATSVISSIFASASCATCIGALFGFLGFNTIIFLAEHRWYILAGAFILLALSIYFAARKIHRGCEVCLVG